MAAIDPSSPKRALAPPARALVAETVHTKLPFLAELLALAPLAGDASNRRYFRLELAGGPPRSLILMQLAEPEAFKQSEEAVSGTAVPVTELPYINVLNHLAKADVAVPTLYYYDQAAGLLYLEDFGDLLLVQACRDATGSEIGQLYREAIETLVRLQSKATVPANPACLAFHRSFDVPLEYYVELMAQHGVAFADRPAFRRLFDLTSIQRNLKAAGRFVYIDRVKKNPKFLADIPRTLGYVRRNLAKYPELATLRKHLAPYVPELE